MVDLARGADLLIADATYPEEAPADSRRYLTDARQAGRQASTAEVGHLLLTHLWPGTDPERARSAAAGTYAGRLDVATADLVVDLA